MPPPDDVVFELVARIGILEEKLSGMAEHIGHDGPRPSDPQKARRWDVPLYWHVSDLRDSLHALANTAQVLIGLIEKLGPRLDRYGQTSASNAEAIARLEAISARIEENIGHIAAEKPLLMRDLFWVDTNGTEISLISILLLEGPVFMSGSESLMRSSMFYAISNIPVIKDNSMVWGMLSGLLGLAFLSAFVSRRMGFRRTAAAACMVYFGATGFLTMWLQPGVLGWILHVLPFGMSTWVFVRGPSRAT